MNIERIFDQYNPEQDVTGPFSFPSVTWAEYTLALKVEELEDEIAELKDRLENILISLAGGK